MSNDITCTRTSERGKRVVVTQIRPARAAPAGDPAEGATSEYIFWHTYDTRSGSQTRHSRHAAAHARTQASMATARELASRVHPQSRRRATLARTLPRHSPDAQRGESDAARRHGAATKIYKEHKHHRALQISPTFRSLFFSR